MRLRPITMMSARIALTPPRRAAYRGTAIAWVSAPDIVAMPAPATTMATLKHAAAKSSDVPSVLKLTVHHSPVGVMLMLARQPTASSIAMRLNVRYASCSIACRCKRNVPYPSATAKSAATVS
jgi:hypothetical protein